MIKQLLVTGGFGFLGSNFLRWWSSRHRTTKLINVDCLTYAGGRDNLGQLRKSPNYTEHRVNLVNLRRLREIWPAKPITVVHFAAETHVDRSLLDAQPFARTNILGTQSLLELARTKLINKLIIISTDEVYGPTPHRLRFSEKQALNPTNPYAAAKASADLLALAYRRTYRLPIVILRSVNVYGPRQYPEKFIPLFIINALNHRALPLYGDGRQQRDWLWVEDFCAAVEAIVGAPKTKREIYHLAAGNQRQNLTVVKTILKRTNRPLSLLRHVADRPGHDRRYALDDQHFRSEFDWAPRMPWSAGMTKTIDWYLQNPTWIKRRTGLTFRDYYRRQYQWRMDG